MIPIVKALDIIDLIIFLIAGINFVLSLIDISIIEIQANNKGCMKSDNDIVGF